MANPLYLVKALKIAQQIKNLIQQMDLLSKIRI